jgi:tetratricopeptide (TPR) repeat protein
VYDVASGARVSVARADDRAGEDARPLFDQLAAKLLDLSGAPTDLPVGLARSTSQSLEAYRAYLAGVDRLNRWDLAGAERDLGRAVAIDSSFGLAYYKLALTRGWLVGTNDSVADRAIVRATALSARLPEHDRTVINAYRAFIGGEYVEARDLYQRLLHRDGGDADAWYGLGEAWFHDTAGPDKAPAFTQAIRAFRRALDLDPNYALAYDHVQSMLGMAAEARPDYALVAKDSFALATAPDGRPQLDSLALEAAVRRARAAGLTTARDWVSTQPSTLRAHGAMVDAYLASGNFDAALGEVDRFRNTTSVHPELPFVEARIRFASGDVDRAAEQLRTALDTVAPQDFRP